MKWFGVKIWKWTTLYCVHTVEHSYNKLLYNKFLDITKQ